MRMTTKFAYKIRRKSDGLFSTGGRFPDFNEIGKQWNSRTNLDRHLSMLMRYNSDTPGRLPIYKDCEVIVLITEVTDYEDIEKFIGAIVERKEMENS